MIYKPLTNQTETGDSAVLHTNRYETEGVAQVDISGGTATVTLCGRMEADGPEVVIETFNASGGKIVALFPFMRFRITAISGATVNAWLSEPSDD